ncbi:MAG TPA: helix-turn-helix domain-containing protein [Streptosporangiales bacterium]
MAELRLQGRERADRILDAAADLLVRHGYRKVTIDDVASRARIGKGTVYLHWRTKRELFEALLLREAVEYVQELLAGLRDDPDRVRPHRMLPEAFLIVQRRPVLRALFSGDPGVIRDRLADSPLRSQELLALDRTYEMLTRHGLLRDDVPNLPYTLGAVHAGFYLLDTVQPVPDELDATAQAQSLAHVVRYAFEPPEPPSTRTLARVATEIVSLFDGLLPGYREEIYGYRRKRA